MKEDNLKKACTELFICLGHIDKELYNLIPIEVFNLIITNMDTNYYFHYDSNKKIYEQKLLEETVNLIGYICYNYWANEKEKEEIKYAIINNAKHMRLY